MSQLIFEMIPKIMAELSAIDKSNNNAMQGFKFRGIDDIYNELHPRLVDARVFTVPEVLEERREERNTKSGGIMTHVILKMKYTFYAQDGSNVSAIVIGEGADTGDKATNKAMSIAHKYAFIQMFAIPTKEEKDPDAESHEFIPKGKPAESVRVPVKTLEQVAKEGPKPKPVSRPVPPMEQAFKDPSWDVPLDPEKCGEFLIKTGTADLKNKKIKDADPDRLGSYLEWIQNKATPAFRESKYAEDLRRNAEAYINKR